MINFNDYKKILKTIKDSKVYYAIYRIMYEIRKKSHFEKFEQKFSFSTSKFEREAIDYIINVFVQYGYIIKENPSKTINDITYYNILISWENPNRCDKENDNGRNFEHFDDRIRQVEALAGKTFVEYAYDMRIKTLEENRFNEHHLKGIEMKLNTNLNEDNLNTKVIYGDGREIYYFDELIEILKYYNYKFNVDRENFTIELLLTKKK